MRFVTTVTCLLVLTGWLFAGDKKARGQGAWAWATAKAVPATEPVVKPSLTTGAKECPDALSEVNECRKARGLPPFQHDPKLTEAALACARERAARGIHGHLPESDFKHLSPTVPTEGVAAGCAAWEDGFGACAMYDNYSHCGAAWVRGADNLKYCHVFCRNENVAQAYNSSAESCANGSCSSTSYFNKRSRKR